jgi:hypothetical protein
MAFGLENEEIKMSTTHKTIIHEGRFAAEVSYHETNDGSPFGLTVSKEDAFKLDRVRLALRRGDVAAAARDAKVYEMLLLAGE